MNTREEKRKRRRNGLDPGHFDYPLLINAGREDEHELWCYEYCAWQKAVTWVAVLITCGLLYLVFHWRPHWRLYCMCKQCPQLKAEFVLMRDQYKQWFVHSVHSFSSKVQRQGPSPASVALNKNHEVAIKDINRYDDNKAEYDSLRYFTNKKVKYLWNAATESYEKLNGLEEDFLRPYIGSSTIEDPRAPDGKLSCSFFHQTQELNSSEYYRRQQLYGINAIVVKVTPIIKLLFTQVLNPFYVFQVFSIILWLNDEYYYYAGCILVVSIISLTVQIYETRTMQRTLKHTVTGTDNVTVLRDGEFILASSDSLVPGDIIEIPRHGCTMQCDAVLLTGNCIVNESMLTGESVPVTKTPLPNPRQTPSLPDKSFSMKEHSRHVLFCGTNVIQTRYYGDHKVKAVVLRTGFLTAKGELVRSILFPKPVDFKFSQDSMKFILVLALISFAGMIYTLVLMIERGDSVGLIVLRTLDLITIVVPPALPAAMTIGIVFAQNRLKLKQIFCISPRSINLCGAINTFCFDKTGTLTEDGLDLLCVVLSENALFKEEEKNILKLGRCRFLFSMATCHSLTIIDNEITGDPLDQKMFDATKWLLDEPGEDTSRYDVFMPTIVRPSTPDVVQDSHTFTNDQNLPCEIGIVRQFPFSSNLQRMSVIARTLGQKNFDLYVKGGPEMIASLCKADTVPKDFHDILSSYTQQGYRVIAMAWKPLKKMSYVKVQRAQREMMEKDLHFLGLMILENRLKPETIPIICELQAAAIRPIMVTGDNMLTALSVAYDCHMVQSPERVILVQLTPPTEPASLPPIQWTYADNANTKVNEVMTHTSQEMVSVDIDDEARFHFALTGKSWALLRQYYPHVLPKLVVRGTIFARFAPEQKQQLIEALQDVGYYVGMCGDGANDCGALKTAHAGISLSEAEASVASPFTSKEPNISCVCNVIREGRAALVTSFGIFKFMACYSLTQFLSVCILYWFGANLTDFTFLYVDMFLLTSLSITFGYTEAYPRLVPEPPRVSLLAPLPILSIVLQMVIILPVQLFIWLFTVEQPWFVPFVPNEDEDYQCQEVTVVFLISSYQFVTTALVFSKGAPYRKTVFSNYAFLANIIIATAINVYVTIYPFQWLSDLMELDMPPSVEYRGFIVGIAIINFLLCYLIESLVIDAKWLSSLCDHLCSRWKDNAAYLHIEEEYTQTPEWLPPVSTSATLAELMGQEASASTDAPSVPPVDINDLGLSDGEYPPDSPKSPTQPLLSEDILVVEDQKPRAGSMNSTVESTVL